MFGVPSAARSVGNSQDRPGGFANELAPEMLTLCAIPPDTTKTAQVFGMHAGVVLWFGILRMCFADKLPPQPAVVVVVARVSLICCVVQDGNALARAQRATQNCGRAVQDAHRPAGRGKQFPALRRETAGLRGLAGSLTLVRWGPAAVDV